MTSIFGGPLCLIARHQTHQSIVALHDIHAILLGPPKKEKETAKGLRKRNKETAMQNKIK
jgi:hypothetical protein